MKKKKDKLQNAGAFFLTLFNRTPAASGLTQMKKVWEVIKKIFIWLGAVFVAIFTVLFVKEMPKQVRHDDMEDDSDEINRKAAAKRDEAIARIERADARELAETYGSVCDAIADGKERFRRRCGQTDDWGSYGNCRRRN